MSANVSKKKIAVKIIIFSCLLGVLLSFASKILMRKDGVSKFKQFYQEDCAYDILFFGSSRVLDAFQPMELWDDYGIRSYNMAQHSENLSINYWQIKNALKYNTPNLVVVDVSLFYGGGVDAENEESRAGFHKQIDHMPLSIDKLRAIIANVPRELYAEYVFPFVLYHSRWNLITKSDFVMENDCRMGSEIRTNIMPQERNSWDDDLIPEYFSAESINLDKIIALCKEENINVLFICMPCNENTAVIPSLNEIEKYLDTNSAEYLNISRDENFLNYATDFSDTSHVNVAGSMKLTKFIADYYLNHYSLIDVDENTINEWDSASANYKQMKDDLLQACMNDAESLMMLTYCDNDYWVEVMTNEEGYINNNVHFYYPNTECDENRNVFSLRIYHKGETVPIVEYNNIEAK